MGCQLTVSRRDPEEDSGAPDLLTSLPNEVLVRIISFLPETRDRVKLRCVSRKLRSISETPSLWREFVWPDYNRREEKCLHNVMKACGDHIRRLSFPQHLIKPGGLCRTISQMKLLKMSEMAKMLQYCSNITHLNLQALNDLSSRDDDDSDEQLKEVMQQLKCLEVLNICCYGSLQPYLSLKIALRELTIHMRTRIRDIQGTQNWMMNGFMPPNLNIVLLSDNSYSLTRFQEFLLSAWPSWNSKIPAGHVACLKLYISYEVPLNLFQNAPVFQLRYGETATLPFVQGNSVGLHDGNLLLTDHDDGSRMVRKGKVCMNLSYATQHAIREHEQDDQLQLDNSVTNLTELDLSDYNIDFKPIIIACPQLQRLNLENNNSFRLEDLQVIATSCCNLQGLNLARISMQDIKFCVKVWEILSSMKLTYLNISNSFFESQARIDDPCKKQLVTLFENCMTLQALELYGDTFEATKHNNYELLSHFPSLEYCRIINSKQPDGAHTILSTCEKLKYFYCSSSVKFPLSSIHNNLQQLCVLSQYTDLDDNFMDTVSAHGGLIHVSFYVNSVTSKGITTLIKNSPNLLTFSLGEEKNNHEGHFKLVSTLLGKKFSDRKLSTSGLFRLSVKSVRSNICTDLGTFWLPGMEQFVNHNLWESSDHIFH